MEMPLLNDIIVIFSLSIIVLFICSRLHIPSIVGFILTGILAGPHGLKLISAIYEVEILAEIGVVLLLFTIGIEFSFRNLIQIKKTVILGGSLQVLLTILVTFIIATSIKNTISESFFMGFLIALSSTAIVLRLLQERAEVNSPHGRATIGILIFQDLVIVPMILFTPLLAGVTESFGKALIVLIPKMIVIILLVIIGTKWIVPQILYQIARTRSRELFMMSVILICLAVAWLTYMAGLSLALGAFLAGLIISESEYSHQALGNILPLRDVFTSFFFISIGMLFDMGFIFSQPQLVVQSVFGVFFLKAIIAVFAAVLLGFSLRTAILIGLALSQVGEFSFILSKSGIQYGLLSAKSYQLFLAVSLLTMVLTPFIIRFAPHIANFVMKLPLPKRLKLGFYMEVIKPLVKRDHLIIIGFGVIGRNLAQAAKVTGISYLIIEMNPETVRKEKVKGEPIYYGDATQGTVLKQAAIKTAKITVVVINDPVATRRITEIIRKLNPKVYLIVRTRFLQEMNPLYKLGADEVISEEVETSVEIFTRVLRKYVIPRGEIERFIAEVRSNYYEMFRNITKESACICDLKFHFPDVEIATFRIAEQSPLVGKTLAQLALRKKYGVNLLAIRRDSQILSDLHGGTQLQVNDLVFVIGAPDKIANITLLFRQSDSLAQNH
jgi:CPA2 family monovalent cation:H+ antiporter-2